MPTEPEDMIGALKVYGFMSPCHSLTCPDSSGFPARSGRRRTKDDFPGVRLRRHLWSRHVDVTSRQKDYKYLPRGVYIASPVDRGVFEVAQKPMLVSVLQGPVDTLAGISDFCGSGSTWIQMSFLGPT